MNDKRVIPTIDPTKTALYKAVARDRASKVIWDRGEFLQLKLDSLQKELIQLYYVNPNVMFAFLCARRLGKSVTLFGLAVEQALKNPGSRILYLSKTTDNVNEIVDQCASFILDGCPDDVVPEFKVKQNKFIFQNKSEIRIKGMDRVGGSAIRGVKADLVILDEFCFMDDLKYLIDSILMPMVIATGGRIILGSTPPDTPGHESIDVIQRCEQQGALVVRTIYDCPRWSPKQIEEFERQAGGKNSSVFRREYLCEVITDLEKAVLPACTAEKMLAITQPIQFPEHFIPDLYVSMDIGFRDLTVILFAFWHYELAKLCVQDEIVLNKASTEEMAKVLIKKKKDLWDILSPHKMICDTDPRLIKDLKTMHGLNFRATKKDNKEAQINQTNIMIHNEQIIVDPKCKTLISHMKYAVWNNTRSSFQRTAALGHCDAVDSLAYLVRNVDRNRNPYDTVIYNTGSFVGHGVALNQPQDKGTSAISRVFGRRR
jgi:hypothetical protein